MKKGFTIIELLGSLFIIISTIITAFYFQNKEIQKVKDIYLERKKVIVSSFKNNPSNIECDVNNFKFRLDENWEIKNINLEKKIGTINLINHSIYSAIGGRLTIFKKDYSEISIYKCKAVKKILKPNKIYVKNKVNYIEN